MVAGRRTAGRPRRRGRRPVFVHSDPFSSTGTAGRDKRAPPDQARSTWLTSCRPGPSELSPPVAYVGYGVQRLCGAGRGGRRTGVRGLGYPYDVALYAVPTPVRTRHDGQRRATVPDALRRAPARRSPPVRPGRRRPGPIQRHVWTALPPIGLPPSDARQTPWSDAHLSSPPSRSEPSSVSWRVLACWYRTSPQSARR